MSTPAAPTSRSGSIERTLLLAVLVPFGALTVVALGSDGIGGFVDAITFNWSSLQIYVDLVIAIVVISVWIHRDAGARGRNPWPWIVASFIVGMFGPLAYLLTRRPNR
jgi:hypothetical protein